MESVGKGQIEVFEGKILRKDRAAVPGGKGAADQRQVGQRRKERHQQEGSGGEKSLPRSEDHRAGVHHALAPGGAPGAFQGEFRQQIEQRGNHQHDDHQSVGDGVGLKFGEPVEDLHRGGAGEAEHEGRPQLREAPDQRDGAPGQDPGAHEGQTHPEKPLPRRRPQIGGGFGQGRVDVAQRRDQIQIADGVEMQRLDETHRPEGPLAAEKVHGGDPQMAKERVDHAVIAQYLLESQSAHEGRQDHGQQQRRVAQPLAGKVETVVEQGQSEGNEKDDPGGADGDGETVPQTFQIDLVAEKFGDELPVAPHPNHGADGQDQKGGEKEQDRPQKQITYEKLRSHEVTSFPQSGQPGRLPIVVPGLIAPLPQCGADLSRRAFRRLPEQCCGLVDFPV